MIQHEVPVLGNEVHSQHACVNENTGQMTQVADAHDGVIAKKGEDDHGNILPKRSRIQEVINSNCFISVAVLSNTFHLAFDIGPNKRYTDMFIIQPIDTIQNVTLNCAEAARQLRGLTWLLFICRDDDYPSR